MGTIQSELTKLFVTEQKPKLSARGFKKRGNTFWREHDGVANVIAFQLPRSDPPSHYGGPDARNPDIGQFWFSIGIAILDGLGSAQSGKAVAESSCDFRLDPGMLRDAPWALRWHLTEPEEAMLEFDELLPRVESWFDAIPSIDAGVALLERTDPLYPGSGQRWRAILSHHQRGKRDDVQRVLDVVFSSLEPGNTHREFVGSFARANGYLAPDE